MGKTFANLISLSSISISDQFRNQNSENNYEIIVADINKTETSDTINLKCCESIYMIVFNELAPYKYNHSINMIYRNNKIIIRIIDSHIKIEMLELLLRIRNKLYKENISLLYSYYESDKDYNKWNNNILKDYKYNENVKDKAINLALYHLRKNYTNCDVSLSLIANRIHLEKSYLCRKFKYITGMLMTDYIRMLRIQEAKCCLLNRKYSIYDTAIEVGYKTQHYFSKDFKKLVNFTPTEYRAKAFEHSK